MHNCAQLLSSAPNALLLAVRRSPAAQPHAPDPGACGVHDLHLPLRQQQHLLHAGAKGGQDDHLPLLHIAKVLAAILGGLDKLDIHLLQALVHACVMGSRAGQGRAE